MENNNRQGCRWTKASERLPEENKLYIIKYGRNEIQYASLFVIKHKLELKMNVEWLDESIEPCVISSEKECAIEFLDQIREYERESGNKICFDERTSEELYEIYKPQTLLTGDRDCEKLKKEVERLKGLIEYWQGQYNQDIGKYNF